MLFVLYLSALVPKMRTTYNIPGSEIHSAPEGVVKILVRLQKTSS